AHIVLGPGAVLQLEERKTPNKMIPGLLNEVSDAELTPDRLSIDPQAMLISQADIKLEVALTRAIGSTGQGVGSATRRKIMRTDAKPKVRLARDEPRLRNYIRPTGELLEKAYRERARVFLEGT